MAKPSEIPANRPRRQLIPLGTVVLVVVLFGLLAMAGWYAARSWTAVQGPPMPTSGDVAMALGVVLSLLVGFALMTLLFYSSRHGYDEQVHDGSYPPENRRVLRAVRGRISVVTVEVEGGRPFVSEVRAALGASPANNGTTAMTRTIRLQSDSNAHDRPWRVAVEQGFFAAEGLDVEYHEDNPKGVAGRVADFSERWKEIATAEGRARGLSGVRMGRDRARAGARRRQDHRA